MSKPEDHPGFKALLKEWNQKLYDSGFKDIEWNTTEGLKLKDLGKISRYRDEHPMVRELRSDYYDLVAENVRTTRFENKIERVIMKLYARGISQKDIKIKLKIEGHRCRVYNPINRWLKAWGLK